MNMSYEKSAADTAREKGSRAYNFSPGPAMLPLEVLEEVHERFLDFQGMGASVLEISHRSGEFMAMASEVSQRIRSLMGVPPEYRILFCHGGGHMQFSAVPLNLMGLKPGRLGLYVDTGNFSRAAIQDAEQFGHVRVIASSADTGYDRIPRIEMTQLDPDASYLHLTSNNTAHGTQWFDFPEHTPLAMVADMTSDIISRPVDVSKFGLIYAGAQKNLGVPGTSVVIVREDLLGHALGHTPSILDFALLAEQDSLNNTPANFTIWVMNLVCRWVEQQGGLEVMQQRAEERARLLYDVIDNGGFYRGYAAHDHRSLMNVCFTLSDESLLDGFLAQARERGLIALKGHPTRGGVRASLYNAMPLEGARALAEFMRDFAGRNG